LNILETSKKVIEQTSIKLSLIYHISDIIEVLEHIIIEVKLVTLYQSSNNDNKTENNEREGMTTFM
jgi:hypothetical protein